MIMYNTQTLGKIRAIQTTYKGYRFRSRLEARWAVFFDTLGIRWEYEPEGFELPDGRRYLPDFRFGMRDDSPECYGEVKPLQAFESAPKAQEFAWGKRCTVYGLDGMPDSGRTYVSWWPYGRDSRLLAVMFPGDIDRAVNAARSARFEFGEHGAAA